MLSEMTRRLVGNVFELDDLGPQLMKGFERPALAFRVVRTEEAASRFDARQRSVPLAISFSSAGAKRQTVKDNLCS